MAHSEEQILALIKKEVKPALGCTEPIAVALAVSKSRETVNGKSDTTQDPSPETPIDLIEVEVSANILKNGMGVGIPGTGMVGLDIAAAIGATCGKSKYGLEVLKDLTPEGVEMAKSIVKEGKVKILLSPTKEKLFVKATVKSASNSATTTISGNHDAIKDVTLNGKSLFSIAPEKESDSPPTDTSIAAALTTKEIYDFAINVPFEKIAFILESAQMNGALVKEGLYKEYGLKVGRSLLSENGKKIFGDNLATYAMGLTAAASDARMAGCTLPAMSNSGSGNQGITVTVPIMAVAEKMKVSEEKLARALVMSHLIAIHIKGHLGKLSALCGCVIASTGSSCGIVYLNGGDYDHICYAIKNMTGNLTGMLCDGAKVGCALKVATGVSSAVQSAFLALEEICISDNDGIIEKDIEKTISNLGSIGSVGMQSADDAILKIMVNKQ